MQKKMLVQGNAGIGRDDLWQLAWRPDYFIAISPEGYRWAKKKMPKAHIEYIPYGVDLVLFEKSKPHQLSLLKPVVLCVGAFIPLKQIDLLIFAMEKVPGASLLIIGQGPLEQKLQLLGTRLLGNRFLLLANVNHDDLIGYYKAVNVFSLPSKSTEALGIVYIEALAAGLPIVATDDNNRREVIGESGIFVNPHDAEAYAKGLRLALSINVNKTAKIQAKKYSWETIANSYQLLFQKLNF